MSDRNRYKPDFLKRFIAFLNRIDMQIFGFILIFIAIVQGQSVQLRALHFPPEIQEFSDGIFDVTEWLTVPPSVTIFVSTFQKGVHSSKILSELFDFSRFTADEFIKKIHPYILSTHMRYKVSNAPQSAASCVETVSKYHKPLNIALMVRIYGYTVSKFAYSQGNLDEMNAMSEALTFADLLREHSIRFKESSDPDWKFKALSYGARDWYQIFGSALVQNTATEFAQLKVALSKAFPVIQNRKDLEIRIYASQQRRNQEPTDFAYDLLKSNKKLELGKSEKSLVDHIFVRFQPQVQDYVEIRNSQNTVQLLEVLSKFEERYSCKAISCSRNSGNVERRGWNEHRISNVDDNRRNWRNLEVVRRPSSGRNDYRGNNENERQGNQWLDSRNRFQKDDLKFNDTGYQFRNGGQKDDFNRNKGSSENFSRDDRRQREQLNVLIVSDVQSDQTQSAKDVPIKLSAIFMSPVELPYVPILLNETFTKA
ncbi:uncharacterized protein TNCV_1914031 [Trichonephila clavipes]|nr:uncharacterized protein TNCV_1914031 [Trichonephila clavipes]